VTTKPTPDRIVVGVDLRGGSDHAVAAAVDLAARFEADLELVHAVRPGRFGATADTEQLAAARHAVRIHLEASLAGAILPWLEGERTLVVAAGHPAEVLLERVRQPGTGLAVVGGHRRHGLLDLRNTTHSLMVRADCPVWVQEGQVRPVRRILVPLDLSAESLLALRAACRWAAAFEAEVLVLHCFVSPELYGGHGMPVPGSTHVVDRLRDEERAEFERVLAAFDWQGVAHETVFVEDTPVAQIALLQDRVDLILLGTHGRTGLSALMLGNTAAAIVKESRVPVVTLRSPERAWLL